MTWWAADARDTDAVDDDVLDGEALDVGEPNDGGVGDTVGLPVPLAEHATTLRVLNNAATPTPTRWA
jgi:hypothetical protein